MKNFGLFCFALMMLCSASSGVAQNVVELDPFLGRSVRTEEGMRLGLFRTLDFQHSSPDSVVFRSFLDGAAYEARGFWSNPVQEEQIVLKPDEFQALQKSVQHQLIKIKKSWQEMAQGLESGELPLVSVEFQSGDLLRGRLVKLSAKEFVLSYQDNTLILPWWNLRAVEVLDPVGEEVQTEPRNPNATRYLFAPSAIPLQQGEGYYQNVYVGVNSINYGLSDHVAVSGGIEMFTLLATIFTDAGIVVGFANVKGGWQVGENLHVGGGVIVGGVFTDSDGVVALGYGLATLGDRSTNLTLSLATGMLNGEFSRAPTIVLGGMHQINARIGLVTENWWVMRREEGDLYDYPYDPQVGYQTLLVGSYQETNSILAFSGGLRMITNKITFDIALVTGGALESRKASPSTYSSNRHDWIPFPVPFLGVVYKF